MGGGLPAPAREVISQRQVIVGLLAIAVGLVFAGFGALPEHHLDPSQPAAYAARRSAGGVLRAPCMGSLVGEVLNYCIISILVYVAANPMWHVIMR